jgi:hypothetical protein
VSDVTINVSISSTLIDVTVETSPIVITVNLPNTVNFSVANELTVENATILRGGLYVGPELEAIRPFKMGFTPWPYNFEPESWDYTYGKLNTHGDIIAHHFTNGIPWDEATNNDPYPPAVEAEIVGRLGAVGEGKDIFLALDPLEQNRHFLIGNWANGGQEARSGAWATRDLDSPEVITAYTNFALDLIDRYQPTHFNYCTECNDLFLYSVYNENDAWTKFVVFSAAVYANIKAVYPDLPLMVSVSLKRPDTDESQWFRNAFAQIANYVDVVGISIYPYAFFYPSVDPQPSELPGDWISQIHAIAPGKRIAITETGYTAENLAPPTTVVLTATSSPAIQDEYMAKMLQAALYLNAEFVIWWCINDFDDGWSTTLASDPIAATWKAIGLYDDAFQPRPALATWDSWLAKDLVNPTQGMAQSQYMDVLWHINTGSVYARGNITGDTISAYNGFVGRSLFALESITTALLTTTDLFVLSNTTTNSLIVTDGIAADNLVINVLASIEDLIVPGSAALENISGSTLYIDGPAIATSFAGNTVDVNIVTSGVVNANSLDVAGGGVLGLLSVITQSGLEDTRLWIGAFATDILGPDGGVIIAANAPTDVDPAASGTRPLTLLCSALNINASSYAFNFTTTPGAVGTLYADPITGGITQVLPP